MRWTILSGLLLSLPAAAQAEVAAASANAFHLKHRITLPVPPDKAFATFAKIETWWSPGHTYGGDSKMLSLEVTPGGCFCEQLANGGVEHLRVVHVDMPGRLVLTGGLGPLLYQAVAAVMDVRFEAAGAGTRVTIDYKAAGFATGGADKLAPAVDGVLAEQMRRFADAASR